MAIVISAGRAIETNDNRIRVAWTISDDANQDVNNPTRIHAPFAQQVRGQGQVFINGAWQNRYAFLRQSLSVDLPWDLVLDFGQLLPETDYRFRIVDYPYAAVFQGPTLRLSSPEVTLRTVPRLAFTSISINARDETSIAYDVRIRSADRYTGPVYWRLTRDDGEEDPIFRTTQQSLQASVIERFSGLFPNRAYTVAISKDPTFPPLFTIVRQDSTPNFTIGGIRDPSLTFDKTIPIWRSRLGLKDFDMFIEAIPAGYVEWNLTEGGLTLTVAELLRALTERVVGGVFEDSFGRWRIIQRSLWSEQPNVGTFMLDEWKIVDTTQSADIEERLAVTGIAINIWQASNEDGTTRVRSLVRRPRNPSAEAIYGRRERSLRRFFNFLPQIPGSFDALTDWLDAGAPTIAIFEIQGTLDEDAPSYQLWAIDPGKQMTVELPHGDGTALHTGLIIRKDISFGFSRTPRHKITLWVLDTQVRGRGAFSSAFSRAFNRGE